MRYEQLFAWSWVKRCRMEDGTVGVCVELELEIRIGTFNLEVPSRCLAPSLQQLIDKWQHSASPDCSARDFEFILVRYGFSKHIRKAQIRYMHWFQLKHKTGFKVWNVKRRKALQHHPHFFSAWSIYMYRKDSRTGSFFIFSLFRSEMNFSSNIVYSGMGTERKVKLI